MQSEVDSVPISDLYIAVGVFCVIAGLVYMYVYQPQVKNIADLHTQLDSETKQVADITSASNAMKANLDATTRSLNAANVTIGQKSAALGAANSALGTANAALAQKTQDLINVRKSVCQLSDDEAKNLSITGYSQNVCINNMKLDHLYNTLDMSTNVLIDSLLTYNSSKIPSANMTELNNFLQGVKVMANKADAVYGSAATQIRSTIVSLFNMVCGLGTFPTVTDDMLKSQIKQMLGYPYTTTSSGLCTINANTSQMVCTNTGQVVNIPGTGLYALADSAGATFTDDNLAVLTLAYSATYNYLRNSVTKYCGKTADGKTAYIDAIMKNVGSIYLRTKNSIVTTMVDAIISQYSNI